MWAAITLLGYMYLALHKRILAVLKVATNVDTTVENTYTVKSAWKYETAKKNLVETAFEMPYCMIKHVFSRSWHCCKVLYKRSSSTHNYSYRWVNESVTSPLIHNPCHARKQRLPSINMNTFRFLAFSVACSVLCSSLSVFGALRKNNQLFYSLTMTLYLEYRKCLTSTRWILWRQMLDLIWYLLKLFSRWHFIHKYAERCVLSTSQCSHLNCCLSFSVIPVSSWCLLHWCWCWCF